MHALDRALDDPGFLERLEAALAPPLAAPLLRDLKVKVTSRCNLACRMCDYWRTTREQTLSTDRWGELFAEAAALGAGKVHVSGGEPFLRRDLVDLLGRAVSAGLKVTLTTNGTLVTRDQARALVDAGVRGVSVSLDGPAARVHDRVRGRPGAFKRSLKTIRWLVRDAERRRGRPAVRVNFTLQRDTLRHLPAMVRLAGELGAADLIPMPVDSEQGLRPSRRQIEAYERDLAPEVDALRRRYGFPDDPRRVHPFGTSPRDHDYARRGLYALGQFETATCYAPWLHTFLAWNGDAFLCCMTAGSTTPLGNVREDGLRAVLAGPAYRAVREAFLAGRHLPHCHRCDLFPRENALLDRALRERARARGRRLVVVEAPRRP